MIDEPCDVWPIEASCCSDWVDAQDAPNPPDDEDEEAMAAYDAALAAFNANQTLQERAVRWATTMLWKRSRRKLGVCTSTVSVCPPSCYCTPCTCGPRHILPLSASRPVVSICSITNTCSDLLIAAERYAIVDGSGVGLVDGTCGWTSGSPFDCGLSIVFTHGWEPDIEASMAMTQLACEYAKWCRGENCKSEKFLKLAGSHKQGKRNVILTGLPLVDHFLIEASSSGSSGMMDPSMAMGNVLG